MFKTNSLGTTEIPGTITEKIMKYLFIIPVFLLYGIIIQSSGSPAQSSVAGSWTPGFVNGGPWYIPTYPYQVEIYINGQLYCGGSMISTEWILTAVKCVNKPAVHVNMNDFVDGLFADLKEKGADLGFMNIKLPEAKTDIESDSGYGNLCLTNGEIPGLAPLSRTNNISVDVTGDSAKAYGNNIAFGNPIEVHYDAAVSFPSCNVYGCITATVNGLTANMWGIVTLNDSETFSVEMKECTLIPESIDVNLDHLGLPDDLLEPVATAVSDIVTTHLNDVVAIKIADVIKEYLKGRIYNIPE